MCTMWNLKDAIKFGLEQKWVRGLKSPSRKQKRDIKSLSSVGTTRSGSRLQLPTCGLTSKFHEEGFLKATCRGYTLKEKNRLCLWVSNLCTKMKMDYTFSMSSWSVALIKGEKRKQLRTTQKRKTAGYSGAHCEGSFSGAWCRMIANFTATWVT